MSTQLLHLDSSILGPHSVGRSLSASVVEKLVEAAPALVVTYRDLAATPIPHFGLGFYNFGIPSQLKAWVDRISIAGKTFRYGETGPVGLCGGKRIIVAIARGGFYGPGSPTASFEHAETCLRNVFGFLGIPQIEVVSAEGLAVGPEIREASIAKAHVRIAELNV